jgi:hypothetical protein
LSTRRLNLVVEHAWEDMPPSKPAVRFSSCSLLSASTLND